MEAMDSMPTDRLFKLLNILQIDVRDGSKVIPLAEKDDDDSDNDDDGNSLWMELAAERVAWSVDWAICALCIMIVSTLKMSLTALLSSCSFNYSTPSIPVLIQSTKITKKDGYVGGVKKKRNYVHTVSDKNILYLYKRCNEMVGLMAELLQIQK